MLFPSPVRAQATIAILGTVNGPGGTPLAGARIQVTNERGETAEARSDASGRYRLVLPARGAAYVVSAEAPDINPVTRLVRAPAGAAELRVDLPMLSRAIALRPVVARVRRLSVAAATEDLPGESGGWSSGLELQREPLGSDDLADLLGAAPGVARTAAAGGAGLSIAGQPADQTRYTVDGGEGSPGAVPREALRDVAVRTGSFDAGRGRFTGGEVALRTQGGGNAWGATLRLDRRDPRLQYGDAPGPLRSRTTVSALDAGGGGPLVRDRLFAFGALSLRRSEAPARLLEEAGAAGLRALGVSPDSVARFLALTSGVRPAAAGADTRGSSLSTGLLRLDAVLSKAHTLTLRLNGQSSLFRDDGSGWALAGTGSELRGSTVGGLAMLASGGARVANELRVNASRTSRTASADDPAPGGIVSVASQADGETTLASLRFAGGLFGDARTRLGTFEVADQLVLTSADRSHRARLGGELSSQEERALPRASPGSFYFSSLADLQAGRPALFTRSFDTAERSARLRRAAFFATDRWRGSGVALNLGARAERAWVDRPAAVNPEVAARFGAAPGAVPSRWLLSPRGGFGFSAHLPWDASGKQTSVEGGFGDFVGVLPLSSLASALAETGLPAAAELSCAGASAPTPDWAAYRADPTSIPTACLDGAPAFASLLAPATLFAPGFSLPRVRRGTLSTRAVLLRNMAFDLDLSLVRGVNLPVARDRNLRETPAFANSWEGGRAVYVPAGAIDAATGAVSATASRRYGDLGVVREVAADGRSRTLQFGAKVFRPLGNSLVQAGYTWTDARERVGPLDAPGGGEASAGADAFGLVWGPAAYTPRHVFNLYFHRPVSRGRFMLGVVARLSSGTPFTPRVAGDVNGDGVANDRAFVFDPDAGGLAGEVPREAMRGLLDDAPGNVRGCLRAQLGRIAAPNSCRTPWSPSLDLNGQVHLGPRIRGDFLRRATLWISAQNVTAGLDYLLHGPERLHGWGQLPAVDPTLLSVRGFDPATRRFVYDVNERFGRPARGGVLGRIPFSLSLQVRVVLGNDQVRSAALREMGSDDAGPLTPARLRLFLVQQWTNVPAEALLQDAPRRLFLTPEQAARLQSAADSVVARREPVLREMVELLTGLHRYDARTIDRLGELRREAVAQRRAGADAARAVLTPEQWAKLPGSLRTLPEGFQLSPPQVFTDTNDS
ncbi:MAG: carboxypeptidase regulatory-like domain-containing protein [Longimicrobiaceae bacterium]